MTTPSKRPEKDEDSIELEKIEDQVPDGRLLLFTPGLIWLNTAWRKLLLFTTRI